MFILSINKRWWIGLAIIGIVSSTITYSAYLAKKIEKEERIKVEQWVEAEKLIFDTTQVFNRLINSVLTENSADIPIILVNEQDSIIDSKNIDTNLVKKNPQYLSQKLAQYRSLHAPIVWENPFAAGQKNKVYYGESDLLIEVRYYPIVQLCIVALFIVVVLINQVTHAKSLQNQLWVGMAKETAHQLGTPVTSLEGWIELLKDNKVSEEVVAEMTKDVNRLKLISDRFGKIGSKTVLQQANIILVVDHVLQYMKKRASGQITFETNYNTAHEIPVLLSEPLMEWVIENILKNALDAMDGKGKITVSVDTQHSKVFVDISDTGKGIVAHKWNKVFEPGYTTKKRGWGLGLALTKRVVETYHNGKIYVLHSAINKGTTFRIELVHQ